MDQSVHKAFEMQELVRFYAQLAMSEGISPEAKELANEYMVRLLKAQKDHIDRLTASSAGIELV